MQKREREREREREEGGSASQHGYKFGGKNNGVYGGIKGGGVGLFLAKGWGCTYFSAIEKKQLEIRPILYTSEVQKAQQLLKRAFGSVLTSTLVE
jgi:hypothetical protein